MTILNWDDPNRTRWQAPAMAVGGLLLFVIALIVLFFVAAR